MAKNIIKDTFKNSFFFKLNCRTSLFLGLFLVVLFSFYLSGNHQNFLDSTQLFVLFLCSVDSIGLFLFSMAGLIESVVLFIVSGKKSYWIFFAVFFLSSVVSAGTFFIVRVLSILTLGTE
ncbi:hypothetical protein [Treponema sp.]|uniref:hypothetical protein n=1 Tax=Treponema sp. TaxID=166 RepID=UPI00388D25D2